MQTIAAYLGSDHKRCDDIFVDAETAVGNNDWDQAQARLDAFAEALEHHLSMEEQVLFPEFERAIGSSDGPTRVMRMEHQQMRSILAVLKETIEQRDPDGFFGYAETFNTMIQQHNMKEESILYVMTDNVLAGRQGEVIGAMNQVQVPA